ncbi:hypothetical protein [Corynebacterium bovis]|uniref:hypothetical protein n=1 Tax=Corynebacterium bovis TaxID=36808 RepID=UPI00163AFA5F|nr:hypothetical protein [Corynebacterium bovis]
MIVVAAVASISGCGSDDGAAGVGVDLVSGPSGVHWGAVGPVRVPVADQGPVATSGATAASSFQRSPQGVGLAAMNIPVRVSFASDSEWPEVMSRSVVANAARDELVTSRVGYAVTGFDRELAPVLEGYRIERYSDDVSDVDVFTSYSDRSKAVTSYHLVWDSGDWKMDLSSDVSGKIESVEQFPDEMVEVRDS